MVIGECFGQNKIAQPVYYIKLRPTADQQSLMNAIRKAYNSFIKMSSHRMQFVA